MAKRHGKRGKNRDDERNQRDVQETQEERPHLLDRLLLLMLGLPRVLRILIVALLALMTVLAVSPIIDEVYLTYFFDLSTDPSRLERLLPSFVTAAIGLASYMAGWIMVVGAVGEERRVTRNLLVYLGICVIALLLVIIWFYRLWAFGDASFS